MLRRVTLALVIGSIVAGCGEEKKKGEEAAAGKCDAAPAALGHMPKLPTGFPSPSEVTYTSERKAGPSRIVDGYWNGELDEAFDGYKDAFKGTGIDVTKDEHEEDDAEVNFSGSGSTGQVKLVQQCKDRTSVSITVRPE